MNENEKKRRDAELDAFWDIDALIPKKKAPYFPSDTSAAEMVLEPPGEQREAQACCQPIPASDEPRRHYIPPHEPPKPQTPELEYEPSLPLIRRVRLWKKRSDYRYYESFVRDAIKLEHVKGGACNRVPFFSYVPQYSQLSRAQLEWYLYWRDRFRNGEPLQTDYSYVLLYVYELINLSDRTEPQGTLDAMVRVWLIYRDIFRQLDSYLPDWICDLCLCHRLPPPTELMGDRLSAVMSLACLKEFYVPAEQGGYERALLAYCSNYDYRKSKFYVEQNRELFDKSVLSAIQTVTRQVSEGGKLFSALSGMDDSKMQRDSFTGALCSERIKRKLEVEYCSFSRSHELRFFIADVVKYTENRIRAALGIRSRLSIYALPASVRERLDAHLSAILPAKQAVPKRNEPEVAEYEKLYDLPPKEFSLKGAAEIERASWETTKRLIEAFEEAPAQEEEATDAAPPIPASHVQASPPFAEERSESQAERDEWKRYAPFLRAALSGDAAAMRAFAAQCGKPEEVVADEINALAFDRYGDIVLEEAENGFAVIEDYREMIMEEERN